MPAEQQVVLSQQGKELHAAANEGGAVVGKSPGAADREEVVAIELNAAEAEVFMAGASLAVAGEATVVAGGDAAEGIAAMIRGS